jgi:hypothetical protein
MSTPEHILNAIRVTDQSQNHAGIAQMVEKGSSKSSVAGSNPAASSKWEWFEFIEDIRDDKPIPEYEEVIYQWAVDSLEILRCAKELTNVQVQDVGDMWEEELRP